MSKEIKRETEDRTPQPGANDPRELPSDLPVPQDDGGAAHLVGSRLPQTELVSSHDTTVDLSDVDGWLVLYCYPRMAKKLSEVPEGWNEIPGARGCTVQSLRYNDDLAEFDGLGATVYGISTETPDDQRDAVKRLGLKQVLLSDVEEELTRALSLPVFEASQGRYMRRLTLCAHDGDIARVWYPVFPPGQDVTEVKAWLEQRSIHSSRR